VALAELRHIGDVFVAFETCARGAARDGVRLEDHVRHLVVHGVLHLVGYDHVRAGQTRDMRAREREILATMGIADPYRPARRSSVKRGAGR
jgi:probable rRNA maturation factor